MPSVISGDANVSATEFGYLDGVTSGLQSQIDSKLNLAGGKILQIVSADYATEVTTTSGSYVTTNLTASITPINASNKVLVMASLSGRINNTNQSVDFRLFRGTVAGTNIGTQHTQENSAGEINGEVTLLALDSPSTTSSQAYTVGFAVSGNTGTAHIGGRRSVIILAEVSA